MSTFNRALVPADIEVAGAQYPSSIEPLRFAGAKLIYSPDNGRTWRNQDKSIPVKWESWEQRSRQTMLFLEEDGGAFSMLSVLQMGKNYTQNRDGYVYIYSPSGNRESTMNELALCRVPKERLLDRTAYEFFAGCSASGAWIWSPDIVARKAVYVFPRGWVNSNLHPYAWLPSVVYNAPLGVYLMTSWGMGTGSSGDWFAKPSYLGFWSAPKPWGPWTQIAEETAWTPAGETAARCFQPQIAPKWIAPDGKSFWLVWTDLQGKGTKSERDAFNAPIRGKSFDDFTAEDWELKYQDYRRFSPYYSFNAQRVDLVLS